MDVPSGIALGSGLSIKFENHSGLKQCTYFTWTPHNTRPSLMGNWHQEEKIILKSILGCQQALFRFPYLLSKTPCATVRFFSEIHALHLSPAGQEAGLQWESVAALAETPRPPSMQPGWLSTSVSFLKLEDRFSHWLKWSLKDLVTVRHLEQLQVCISVYFKISFLLC